METCGCMTDPSDFNVSVVVSCGPLQQMEDEAGIKLATGL